MMLVPFSIVAGWLPLSLASAIDNPAATNSNDSLITAPEGGEPGYPYDPRTTTYCSWWADNDGHDTCDTFLD